MEQLLAQLADALDGAAPLAIGAALAWGVLSIVLSPCHLASIPLVIAFISRQDPGDGDASISSSGRRGARLAAAFAIGILVTITAIGLITASLGRMLGDTGSFVDYGIATILIVLGLHFIGVIPLPGWSAPGIRQGSRRGLLAAFLLGLLFGIGVGPCTFAFMAPIVGVTLKVATRDGFRAFALLLAYGLGHCSVIVLAGISVDRVQRYLDWTAESRGTEWLRRACGVLVILGGLYLIYAA